jgi:hypothetical protein
MRLIAVRHHRGRRPAWPRSSLAPNPRSTRAGRRDLGPRLTILRGFCPPPAVCGNTGTEAEPRSSGRSATRQGFWWLWLGGSRTGGRPRSSCARAAKRDDGVGGADKSAGLGLEGLRDRGETIGGRFEVHSVPGGRRRDIGNRGRHLGASRGWGFRRSSGSMAPPHFPQKSRAKLPLVDEGGGST